ncbi:MAG: hypothetical protein PHQ23_09185 [Candidatus Wallbacteria bacterium]|nr:hypothetical protein [Candidatus Wallbacteria bacterium]
MKKILLGFFNLFFTVLGLSTANFLVKDDPKFWSEHLGEWVGNTPYHVMYFLFGATSYLLSNALLRWLLEWYDRWIENMTMQRIWNDFSGGVLGLVAGNLFFTVPYYFFYKSNLEALEEGAREIFLIIKIFSPLAINLISFFIGVTLLGRLTAQKDLQNSASGTGRRFLVDSNILIDGRINEMVKTGILDGVIVVHETVIKELQTLADSSDHGKRLRGRKGLNLLEKLQLENQRKLEISSQQVAGENVDDRLVNFAKEDKSTLFTNDYNLVKIARLQLVPCLSLNEISGALRPVIIPGEDVVVELVKRGKENHQAVGYLEDGTMIVVEHARKYLGRLLEATVTNIIQTQAGRIIFAKLKNEKKEE